MSFSFVDYGTFTGPNSVNGDYNYDEVSKEGSWWSDLPVDGSFKLSDLAVVLFHNSTDYIGFHVNGTNTSLINLASHTGNIPSFIVKVDNTTINGNILANGNIIANGSIAANGVMTLAGIGDVAANINLAKSLPAKPFDIPHPSKPLTHRLRHVSLEGPEIGVYIRGKLINSNVIELPSYWIDLVDMDTISVQLTPIGTHQELYADEDVEWGRRIIIKNNSGTSIKCFYTVFAERKDMEKLVVEYEGATIKDYPGQDWLRVKETI
jgi:hypothetical protein